MTLCALHVLLLHPVWDIAILKLPFGNRSITFLCENFHVTVATKHPHTDNKGSHPNVHKGSSGASLQQGGVPCRESSSLLFLWI